MPKIAWIIASVASFALTAMIGVQLYLRHQALHALSADQWPTGEAWVNQVHNPNMISCVLFMVFFFAGIFTLIHWRNLRADEQKFDKKVLAST